MMISPAWVARFEPKDFDPVEESSFPTARTHTGPDAPTLPAILPGVLDASGGFQSHRIDIAFQASGGDDVTVTGVAQAERGPAPELELSLDGRHHGLLYLDVRRNDRSDASEPGPVAGVVEFSVTLPAAWLQPGDHTLSVATVLDASLPKAGESPRSADITHRLNEELPPARSHYGRWFGSYLRWHSLEITASSASARSYIRPTVELVTTPFYLRQDTFDIPVLEYRQVTLAGERGQSGATVSWADHTVTMPPLPDGYSFGTTRARFAAPDFTDDTEFEIHDGHVLRRISLRPQRKWTLHLVPHVHLDLGFTDPQSVVLELHCRNIDRALHRMESDDDYRFSVDGSVIVGEYKATRSAERYAQLLTAIRAGRIGVNALHSNLLTGLLTLPELEHALDFGKELPISERTQLRYANITDVPTHSRAIPSVLAANRVHGFVAMSNHGRAATRDSDALHLISPVRWVGPDGAAVLAHFADHYSQLRFMAADPQSVVGATSGIQRYINRFNREDYLPDQLAIIGTHADNEDAGDGDTSLVSRWNDTYAWPKMRISTFDEYLSSVRPLEDSLPQFNREMGSFWEDGAGSTPQMTSKYRRAQVRLPQAEKVSELISGRSLHLKANEARFSSAWAAMSVAAEHTYTWARSTAHPHASAVSDQLEWKSRHVDEAHRVATDETRRALSQLVELEALVGPGILIVNPLPFEATLSCELELADGVSLLDHTGQALGVETLSDCAGLRRVRIVAADLPGFGWRYLPASGSPDTVPAGSTGAGGAQDSRVGSPIPQTRNELVTGSWRVELSPETNLPRQLRYLPTGESLLDENASSQLGQIIRRAATPFDLLAAQELARPGRCHGHERRVTRSIEDYHPNHPVDPTVAESPHVDFVEAIQSEQGTRLFWRGGGGAFEDVVIELWLSHEQPEAEMNVSFDKHPSLDMEATYVAFPFRDSNDLKYDRPLGWVYPEAQHAPGASNEWATVSNSVALTGRSSAILWTPLDAPLFTTGRMVRGEWPTSFKPAGPLYSYVTNNVWMCNTPALQQGRHNFSYRFSLQTNSSDSALAAAAQVARTDALAIHLTQLQRWADSRPPEYREGLLA